MQALRVSRLSIDCQTRRWSEQIRGRNESALQTGSPGALQGDKEFMYGSIVSTSCEGVWFWKSVSKHPGRRACNRRAALQHVIPGMANLDCLHQQIHGASATRRPNLVAGSISSFSVTIHRIAARACATSERERPSVPHWTTTSVLVALGPDAEQAQLSSLRSDRTTRLHSRPCPPQHRTACPATDVQKRGVSQPCNPHNPLSGTSAPSTTSGPPAS